MLTPKIETLERRVKLTYPDLPDFKLEMDFNPFVEVFKLSGEFCLLHWQAKPFGERRWGVYDEKLGKYFSCEWNKLALISSFAILLQIEEKVFQTIPVAVICFKNSRVEKGDYISIISSSLNG